jgi:hypothetical protein
LRHVEVKQYFLRELKEAGIIECHWKKGEDMTSDVFTKNLPGPLFEKHIKAFVGEDKYMSGGPPEGRVSGDGQNRESHNLHESSEVAQMGLDYNEAYSEYREWMDAVVSH